MSYRVLIVDDDESMRFFLTEAMKKRGYEVSAVGSAEDAFAELKRAEYDLTLMDIRLPGMNGIDAIGKVRSGNPHAIIIVMTAHDSRDFAIDAVRAGAYDYFNKPIKVDELGIVIERALERRRLQREIDELGKCGAGHAVGRQAFQPANAVNRQAGKAAPQRKLTGRYAFDNIVGNSGPMQEVFALVSKVVDSDVTVLIYGESGTGKELIAQAIHNGSVRKNSPFVKLNCVAIPEGLLESELFGHEKGAFTGATARKPGKFEMANSGTIFLDEIGDMSLTTQAKILRVLQEREFERVGGTETVGSDVRVIAATNKDLLAAVEAKEFREDLYFRLNVFSIVMPPLRERKEDIPPLVEHFMRSYRRKTAHPWRRNEDIPVIAKNIAPAENSAGAASKLSNEAMQLLMAYDWPGNVRELENCIQRALVMAESDVIGPESLPPHIQQIADSPRFAIPKGTQSIDQTLFDVEKQIVVDALNRTAGVQSKAAMILGISERSLWHRVKKLAINVAAIKRAS